MTTETAISTLSANLATLPAKDQSFAASLLDAHRRGRLSEKQAHWIGVLAERATTPRAEPARVDLGSVEGILALFDRAASRLKAPAFIIKAPWSGAPAELRLSRSGNGSREPGSVVVTEYAPGAGFGERAYFGRISRDGKLALSPRMFAAEKVALESSMRELAADPAGVASRYGRLTGRCCICARRLTDERSTAVGYGETCASNFGLPYPSLAEARATHAAAA